MGESFQLKHLLLCVCVWCWCWIQYSLNVLSLLTFSFLPPWVHASFDSIRDVNFQSKPSLTDLFLWDIALCPEKREKKLRWDRKKTGGWRWINNLMVAAWSSSIRRSKPVIKAIIHMMSLDCVQMYRFLCSTKKSFSIFRNERRIETCCWSETMETEQDCIKKQDQTFYCVHVLCS